MKTPRIRTGGAVRGSRVTPAAASPDLTEILNRLDTLDAQVSALQAAIAGTARNPNLGEFDPGFSDPPTIQDLQNIQAFLNQLTTALNR